MLCKGAALYKHEKSKGIVKKYADEIMLEISVFRSLSPEIGISTFLSFYKFNLSEYLRWKGMFDIW